MTNNAIDFRPPLTLFEKCDVDTHVLLSSSLRQSHTFKLYEKIFAQADVNARLLPFELDLNTTEDRDTLHGLFMALRENVHMKSLMISNPFKEEITLYCDGVDQASQRAGAVNMVLKHKIILTGINTDGEAFLIALQQEGLSLEGANICFLGCGGVSSAVATTVANQCKSIALLDINEAKAGKLKVRLSEGGTPDMVRLLDPEDRDFSGFDVIFNGTGLGKDSGNGSDLSLSPLRDSDILPTTGTAIDAVYTPAQTAFLLQCEKSGLRTMNGLGQMLGNTFLHLQRATDLQITFEQIKEAHSELFQTAAD